MTETFKVISSSSVLVAYFLGVKCFPTGFPGSCSVSFAIFYFLVLNTIFKGITVILINGGPMARVPVVIPSSEKSWR